MPHKRNWLCVWLATCVTTGWVGTRPDGAHAAVVHRVLSTEKPWFALAAGVCCGWVHPLRTSCPRTLQVGCGSNSRLPKIQCRLQQAVGCLCSEGLLTVWAGLHDVSDNGLSPAQQPTGCCYTCQPAHFDTECAAMALLTRPMFLLQAVCCQGPSPWVS